MIGDDDIETAAMLNGEFERYEGAQGQTKWRKTEKRAEKSAEFGKGKPRALHAARPLREDRVFPEIIEFIRPAHCHVITPLHSVRK